MSETKFLKAYCPKIRQYYGLEIKKYDREWEIVNIDTLEDDKARLIASDNIRQSSFKVHDNLLPCPGCGKRDFSGCSCTYNPRVCRPGMKYNFACVYCSNLEIDYSLPTSGDTRRHAGKTVTVQGKEVKVVNFSNVEWRHFDRMTIHPDGRASGYDEPTVHVIANNQNIEFHGYNISEMNEGVYYTIGHNDDFDIECDVDTTTIQEHPGGHLFIDFGPIQAQIKRLGGEFFLDGHRVAKVGSRFKMRLSLTEEGHYRIYINGILSGDLFQPTQKEIKVIFGFYHASHNCERLSHAYMRGIKMQQAVAQ